MNACSGNVLSKKVLEYQVDHLLGGWDELRGFRLFLRSSPTLCWSKQQWCGRFCYVFLFLFLPHFVRAFSHLGRKYRVGQKKMALKDFASVDCKFGRLQKRGILWEFCQQERLSLCDFWQTNLVTLTKFTQGNYYHHHANLNHHQLNHVHGHHHRHKAVQKSEGRQSPVSLGDIGRAFYWGCSSTAFRLRHPSLTSDEDHAEDIDVEDEYEEANDDHPLLPPQITTSFLVYGPKKSSFARAES